MPPKADGGKAVMSNDTFLAACIKHGKEKLAVNFDTLAKDLNMSAGGAANKFRNIMKQFESEGAAWANKDTATASPKTKTTASTKRKATSKKDEIEGEDSGEGQSEEPSKKKAKGKGGKTKAAAAVDGEENDAADEKKPKVKGAKAKSAAGNGTTATGGPKKGGKKIAPKVSKEDQAFDEPLIKEEEEGNQADDEIDDEADSAIKAEDNDEDA
ncbi:hypothetical protein A1O3_08280 [Capronia epimyces CBS 606.96]|uniref:Myb-like DNA-binding domain-containing protein n=1 Tax=Capronia epimyces CBS 606.96 TaxID=1182542 RepID=W9YCD4_9EURO|nr:uncharacterized protein A1O3_08280 [Capronia epimyces CBS 606.96]EXJ79994.1 hypothetical protein A1O3_08280 [Capronia epimyces CBS 606.96]